MGRELLTKKQTIKDNGALNSSGERDFFILSYDRELLKLLLSFIREASTRYLNNLRVILSFYIVLCCVYSYFMS